MITVRYLVESKLKRISKLIYILILGYSKEIQMI